MTRKDISAGLRKAVPRAQINLTDGMGTRASPHYVDVTFPTEDLPLVEAYAASIGRKAVFISVLPNYGRSHRVIQVAE